MDALDAPGSGELVHPDFGTVDVMVDSWECRTKADELNYYAFTVTVYPSLQDTRWQRADGVVYSLADAIVIDRAGTTEITVTALAAGEAGNTGENTLLTLITPVACVVSDAITVSGCLRTELWLSGFIQQTNSNNRPNHKRPHCFLKLKALFSHWNVLSG